MTQLGVALVADRRLQRYRVPRQLAQLLDLDLGHHELLAQLLVGGHAAETLGQALGDAHELVQPVPHVQGQPDRPRLVADGTEHRLADPPGGVGGELVAAAVVELLHRPDQPHRPLLDEVQERKPPAQVRLGDRDHQPQVGLDHLLLRPDVAALDPLGQRDLLVGREQLHAPDRAQVQPQ